MAQANVLSSLGEGFRLIGRAPLAVVAWGLVTLLATLIPMLILLAFTGAEIGSYYQEVFEAATDAADEMPMPSAAYTAVSSLVQLLQIATSVVSGALVYAAVYRAVLRPEDKGFAYLKFSMEEVYVGVVLIVLTILAFVVGLIGAVLVLLPLMIGVAAMAASGAGVGAALLVPIVVLILLVGLALLYARFGMALPMTFAERQIRIFESWDFTKGYAGQLVGLALLQLLMMIALYIAAILVVMVVLVGSFAGLDPASLEGADLSTLFTGPGSLLQRFLAVIVVGGLMYLIVMIVMQPILIAPWARAYERIAAERLETRTDVFG